MKWQKNCTFAGMNYQTHTLKNGMRIIHRPSTSAVIYCGVAVGAGTRHELSGEEGLAHFCEHMAFKGTHRRTAVQIINALEGVGGELNAFTNKEDTVYYAATTQEHFRQAVDVLCDIVFCSQYPEHEIEKEREVVCDEIESYEDSPSELIFDEFENLLFKGHPLGHNILGTSERVREYTAADARQFVKRNYRPDNSIFFVSGDVDFNRLVRWLDGAFESYEFYEANSPCKTFEPNEPLDISPIIRHRNTHQAHVMMGARTFPVSDVRRWPLFLLNNILGGPGLNSRLNLSLRERNGLVYTVESAMVCYGDTGAWSVYFGCDPHDVKRCCRLVRRELDRLMHLPLSESQLRRAKQQIRGQLTIAADNREQSALDFARTFLHHGIERQLSDILTRVDTLTAKQLQQVAREVFDEARILTLVYE